MTLREENRCTIAYFSMEIALDAAIPIYSGGLGVLAGDSLRAAADLGLPMVAVTLLHRQGYFRQRLDPSGNQFGEPYHWQPEEILELMPARASVVIGGRRVEIAIWRYRVEGSSGRSVPVYLLDASLPENDPDDRELTGTLYGGDNRYRLRQEVLLGAGGVSALRALGYRDLETYHMNEGHSALLTLALVEELMDGRPLAEATQGQMADVRRRCVFTVHTPVVAGHDRFPAELVAEVLNVERGQFLERILRGTGDQVDMTALAMFFSRSTNAVSIRHREATRSMHSDYSIAAITNGVHAATWVSPPLARLFNERLPGWRQDNALLRYAAGIPAADVLSAHEQAKQELLAEVQQRAGLTLDRQAFTVGFARRATGYKRADLLLADPQRLRQIVRRAGPIQVIYGGKAHPNDESGKALIRRVFEAAESLKDALRIVYLEEYDMALARYLVSGVDLWLNTPEKPLEASGTSGMKAALNGVPSLSVVDGWWVEGHIEGVTGWAIGEGPEAPADAAKEAASLYDKLEYMIMPMFYKRPSTYAEVMRSAIGLNGWFFNAQRMMSQYMINIYDSPAAQPSRGLT